MANIKSAKKKAKQDIVRTERNLARATAIKTAIKKVLAAVAQAADFEQTKVLLKDVEAKLARAKSKGLLHANTASRKLSRLSKKVAQTFKQEAASK
ncbi:30S ribosomal protein S20 [Candidatus Dependentiae bacterium]|nr:30S ribosomal protein S20 [Candidatus Dependentiae bacterium]